MPDTGLASTVAEVEKAGKKLVASLRALPPTTDASLVIEKLGAIERELATAYERLADTHERAALGDLIHDAAGPANPGLAQWLHADVALRTAASLARGAADSLHRARHDGAVASWYDAIETDRRQG